MTGKRTLAGNDPTLSGLLDPRGLAGLPADAPLVVAFSGGADSTALLSALTPPIHALHVHHGMRGEEADRDAAFCRELCERRGVPFTCLYTDVPKRIRETGESPETAARAERYRLLERFAAEGGFAAVVTAHHADDQLETLLQHLLRGSGLRGLCGIPPVRALGDTLLIRPMLGVTKEEILAFLARERMDFVTDTTNLLPDCGRNRLRLSVLPRLRELTPDAAKKAAEAAELLSEDEAYLTELATAFLKAEGGSPRTTALAELPRPIFVRVIRALLPVDLSRAHYDALRTLVQRAVPHSALSLPHTRARITEGRLCLDREEALPLTDYCLPLGGEIPIPEARALVSLTAPTPELCTERSQAYKYAASISFASDAVKGTLIVRNRRAGDTLARGGIHKAVRRLEGLSQLPPTVRARMPLLADDAGVLAVPFGGVRTGAAQTEKNDTTVWFWFN